MNANDLQSLCATWSGVSHSIKWEDDLVFSVVGRVFAVLRLRGPDRERLSFGVDSEHFVELTTRAGIVPAHYAALAFWVTVVEPEQFTRAGLEAFVRRSYELVVAGLSKKQRLALEQSASTGVGSLH